MASGQSFTATINVVANIGDAIKNIKSIQTALENVKLPSNFKNSLNDKFKSFYKEAEKYQEMLAKGPKTRGDASSLERSGDKVLKIYESISKELNSIDNKTLKNAFKDMGNVEVERLKKQLNEVKTTLSNVVKESNFGQSLKSEFETALTGMSKLGNEASTVANKLKNTTFKTFTTNLTDGRFDLATNNLKSMRQQIEQLNDDVQGKDQLIQWITNLENGFNQLKQSNGINSLILQLSQLKGQLTGAAAQAVEKLIQDFTQMGKATEQSSTDLRKFFQETNAGTRSTVQLNSELDQLKNRITYFFGLANGVALFRRALRDAINTTKELDAVMTQTAVVSDKTVGDMWKTLPQYSKEAKKLGAAIKDVYSAQTLYVQQGLNMNDAMDLGVETLKMARVAGIDAAEATNSMTAALRGFNMELNESSAIRINDVYSKLAQTTASDVQEISIAMSKTAALANSANMSFENTAAFLATIIESTREGAETAGTALKTVIARFTEVKKLYSQGELAGTDEEGQEVDVNKISAALRTAGINMNDFFTGAKGLDEIFMELGSKWNSLTTIQQRYIATMAAGSRQQSRFLALMQNYNRTMELTQTAYNSAGSGQEQFEKTLDSLQAKINQFKAAWDTFVMGIANSDFIKGAIDAGTRILELINKIIDSISGGNGLAKSIASIAAAFGIFRGGREIFNLLIGGANGKGGVLGSIIGKFFGDKKTGETAAKGFLNGFSNAIKTGTGKNFLAGTLKDTFTAQSITLKDINVQGLAKQLNGLNDDGSLNQDFSELENNISKFNINSKEVQQSLENIKQKYNETEDSTDNFDKALQQNSQTFKKTEMSASAFSAGLMVTGGALMALGGYLKTTGKAGETWGKIIESVGISLLTFGSVLKITQVAVSTFSVSATASISSIPIIGWIAAVISALVALGIALSNAFNESQAKRLERINEACEKVAEGVEQVKNKFKENQDLINEINDQTNVFDELIIGTEEWNTAVQNLNESILQLLTVYPELAGAIKWVNDHLELDIQSEVYKNWLQQQQENIKNGTIATAASNVISYRAENEARADKDSGFTRGYYTRGDVNQFYDWISQGFYKTYSAYGKNIGSFLRSQNPTESKNVLSDEELTTLYSDFINQIYPLVTNGTIQTTGNFGSAFKSFIEDYKINDIQLTQEQQEDALNLFSRAWTLEEDSNPYKWLTDFLSGVYEYQQTNVGKIREQMGPSILAAFSESKYAKMDSVYANAYKNFALKDFSEAYGTFWSESEAIKDYMNTPGNREKYRQAAGLEKVEDIDEDLFKEYSKAQVLLDTFFKPTEDWSHGMNYLEKYFNSLDDFNKNIAAKLISNDINSLTKDEYKALAEYNVDLKENFSDFSSIDISSFANTYEKFFNGLEQTDRQVVEDFSETIGQIEKFSKITEQIEKNGGNIEKIFSIFDDTFKGIDSKTVSQAKEILSVTDFGDRASIRNTIKQLNELGLNIDSNLTKQIIDATKAIAKFNLKSLEEQIKSLESGKSAVQKISEGNRQISAEEYTNLLTILPDFNTEDWVRTGLDEYTYIGEETNSLLASIDAAVGQLVAENIKQTEEDIFKGQQIGFILEDKVGDEDITVNKAIEMLTENSESLNEAVLSGLRTKFGLATNTDVEGILDYYNKYYGLEGIALQSNQEKLAGLQTYAEVGYNQSSAQYLLNQATTGDESASRALEAQAINNDLLLKVEDYSKKLELTTEQTIKEKDALNALAIIANITEKNIDALNGALDKDFQILKTAKKGTSAYNDAMNNILKTAKKVFGNDITSEWIETHIEQFNALASGGDAAEKAFEELSKIKIDDTLKRIQQEGVLTGDVLNIIQDNWNDLNGSELEIGGTADFSEIFAGMELTQEQAAALSEYLNSIPNISAVWEPGKGIDTDNDGVVDIQTGTLKITKTGASGSGLPTKSGGGGGGGGKEFKNDFDKYYNMVEDINELTRLRNLLETDYNQLLASEATNGKQIYDNLQKQIDLLKERRDITADLAEKRKQQILDAMQDEQYSDLGQYAWWNNEDQTVEINWSLINDVKDSELGDRIQEYVSVLEGFQSKYDEQIEALEEIESTLQEIEKRGRDQYISLEDRIRDALIKQIQDRIDELSASNEGINTANQNLLQSIQDTLSLQRQERENAKTEEELTDKEQRLAYLQQDSSGANALEIAKLQEEIADARQNYTDSLIDQKINELQEQNDKAAEQRQEQIDLLQQSLDWQEKNGQFWEQAYEIMNSGIGPNGDLVKGSQLEALLKQGEGWKALSDESQMTWLKELETQVAEATAYLAMTRQLEDIGTSAGKQITFTNKDNQTLTGIVDKNGNVVVKTDNGTVTYKNVYQSYDGTYHTLESEEDALKETKPATSTQKPPSNGNNTPGGNSPGGNGSNSTDNQLDGHGWYSDDTYHWHKTKGGDIVDRGEHTWNMLGTAESLAGKTVTCNWCGHKKTYPKHGSGGGGGFNNTVTMKYATGGLNTKTGPAWLDGTPSKPELILNARDTQNFIELKDTLAAIKNSGDVFGGNNNYYDIDIQVDQMSSDYDVDRAIERLRNRINEINAYRNVNNLSRLR